jgi:hypothetical protein
MIQKFAAIFIAFLLIGCASEPAMIDVQYLSGKGAYPPQPYITVLNSTPSTNYVSIANLVATGSPGLTKTQLLAALQQKAQALGANAIIVTDESQTVTPNIAYNPAGGQYSVVPPQAVPKFSGLAIHIDTSNNTSQ